MMAGMRTTARKARRRALLIAVLSATLVSAIYSLGAEGKPARAGVRVKGVRVRAMRQAVVNFGQLARRQASGRLPTQGVPQLIPEPKEIDDSVSDGIKGEPAPDVPVDIRGPHVPSPGPVRSFAGLDDIAQAPPGTPFFNIPPDTMGAVGTDAVNRVFVNLNNNYRIENKTTGAQIGSDVSMPNFWASTGATSPFDPRIQYDPYNDRWIVAAVSDAGLSTAAILVGVSTTSDPGGTYSLFKVAARVGGDPADVNFADFPMLGFNKNWVAVSINMFNNTSGAFTDGRLLVINYPTLRTGTLSSMYFTGVTAANGGFCMHPATTYSSSEGTEYLVSHLSSASATYRMHTITGTAAAPVFTLGTTKTRPGGGWISPGGNILPQAMGTCTSAPMKFESADAFVRANVVFRNSAIWYPQTIGLPSGGLTHTAAQWTELNTSGDVVQGGRVEDATATATNGGLWYAYPSIAVNSTDDVLFGFSQFSSASFASGDYAYRDHSDTAGTIRDPVIFKAGEDCYSKDFGSTRNRWGDYSHTMADPTGDSSFWTIQEYAKLQAPPTVGGSNSKWGTWLAKVDAVAVVVTATPTVTVTRTATPTNTATRTVTATGTRTVTPTVSSTRTVTATGTATRTVTATGTRTVTPTVSSTVTVTATGTATRTVTATGTRTVTPTVSSTRTVTATGTATRTVTATGTRTVTPTVSSTVTVTATRTATRTVTATGTRTVTPTASSTVTVTSTRTSTRTVTSTPTRTPTMTPTPTRTPTPIVLANRVFVSARTGNDANNCASILTPCQTLAGAVADVASGGEAIILDSGGYGPVTITRPVTIEAPPGVLAFVHPPSGDAITVNAGVSDKVVVRGLTLNGGAANGITLNTAGSLHVENCVISGFLKGLAMTGPGLLFVKDTVIRGNSVAGLDIAVAAGTAAASIDRTRFESNGVGVAAGNSGKASIRSSVASGNASGLTANGTSAEVDMDKCLVANNATVGIASGPTGGSVRVTRSVVTNNGVGLQQSGSGTLLSRTDNTVEGNTTNTSGTIGTYTAK